MANVIKEFFVSQSNVLADNKGTEIPQWSTGQRWFWSPPDSEPTSYDYAYSSNGDNVYIQYGFNMLPFASVRCYTQKLVINTQTDNPNGSTDVNFTVEGISVRAWEVDREGTPFRVSYKLTVLDTVIWESGIIGTRDTFSYTFPDTFTRNINIPASERYTGTCFKIETTYPDGEYPNNSVTMGFSLYNTLPPTYQPNFKKVNSVGYGINERGLSNKVRVNGVLREIPAENISTIGQDTGYCRVRVNGTRKQARAYNNNGVIE